MYGKILFLGKLYVFMKHLVFSVGIRWRNWSRRVHAGWLWCGRLLQRQKVASINDVCKFSRFLTSPPPFSIILTIYISLKRTVLVKLRNCEKATKFEKKSYSCNMKIKELWKVFKKLSNLRNWVKMRFCTKASVLYLSTAISASDG